MQEVHVVGAAILRAGRCLVAQRSASMSPPLVWEFPGGKVEPAEDPRAALTRELREELSIEVAVGALAGTGRAESGGRSIVLDVYFAELLSGEPHPDEHAAVKWLGPDELPALGWAAPDVPVVRHVVAELRQR